MFYLEHGFPARAAAFIGVLQAFYQTENLHLEMFDVKPV
jgi:elongation factor P hydroxylase